MVGAVVTDWTYWDNSKYEDANERDNLPDDYDYSEWEDAVIKALREGGYKFSGYYHQDGATGVPVINGKYLFQVSYRVWGGIMAKAYPSENPSENDYIMYAWGALFQGEEVVPPATLD